MIAVYDDRERTLTVHRLETVEDMEAKGIFDPSISYGTFKPCYKIEEFRMLPTDICVESGQENFFYLARQNQIYKVHVSDESLRKA